MSSAHTVLAAVLTATLATGAAAETRSYTLPDETAQLRPSPLPGHDLADAACAVCHSVDYITTQPPRQGRAFWQGEVTKMVNVYHAPVDPGDVKAIVDYLDSVY